MRFTENQKWNDPWFRNLKPIQKLFWLYILDVCDNAGVWNPDWPDVEFRTGAKVGAWQELASPFEGRIKVLPSGKLWVIWFVEFQQKTTVLNPANAAHRNIVRLLENEGISDYQQALDQALSECNCGPLVAPSKEPVRPLSNNKGEGHSKSKGSLEEILLFCVELEVPRTDGESCFHKWEGNGWKNGNAQIKDWKATMRSWKAAGYLPSQKQNNGFGSSPKPQPASITRPL
jgi:hypothetical protein